MKKICLFFLLFLVSAIFGQEVTCEDNSCRLPGASAANGKYKVLLPVGETTVKAIKQPPRLKTLSGKTIAIVGGSFMARITHPELKRLILRDYPDAKVLVLGEIGSAGVWGAHRPQKDDFIANLKKYKVDAVISGNGGCGLCTPKEVGSCIAAEYNGIPSVMIAAPGFSEQAESAAYTAGIPVMRVAVYPGAFSAHSEKELLENTRKVLYPQIIKALTEPIGDQEVQRRKKQSMDKFYEGTLPEVNQFFAEHGWSDGLPVMPPTLDAVEEFLKFTDLPREQVVAAVPPSYRKITVELVAVNGVMAGCPPEFMPVLLAFTEAMADGNFRRTLASTHAWTPYCWINGPISRQLGIDHTQGVISHQRNALIGRFINLAMLNFGGYYIQQNRMGTFGYLMPWALAEDEKSALQIGWLPYHMQMGYGLNENTLTAASALNWGNNLSPATSNPAKIMEMIALDAVEKEQFALGSGTPFVFRTFLITAPVGKDLAKRYKSKNAFEDALVATALRPAAERAYANYWANPGSSFDPQKYPLPRHISRIFRQEQGRRVAVPEHLKWTKLQNIDMVPVMQTGKSAILITGDASRNKAMCLPGGGNVTIKINLPAKWDELMSARGYAPLSTFFLKSNLKPVKNPRKFDFYRTFRK